MEFLSYSWEQGRKSEIFKASGEPATLYTPPYPSREVLSIETKYKTILGSKTSLDFMSTCKYL